MTLRQHVLSRPILLALLAYLALVLLVILWPGGEEAQESAQPANGAEVGQAGPLRPHDLQPALRGLRFENGRVFRDPSLPREIPTPPLAPLLEEGHRRFQAGSFTGAVEAYARAVRHDPESVEALDGLGRALFRKKDSEKAEAAFATALDLAPESTGVRFRLAAVISSQGRRGEAMEQWRRILDQEPDHGPSHGRLAATLALLGEKEEARQHLQEARRLAVPVSGALEAMVSGHELEALAAPRAPSPLAVRPSARGGPVVGPPRRVDVTGGTFNAVEPSIVAGGTELVAAWNDERRPAGVGAWSLGASISLDRGETWHDCLLAPPGANETDFEGDPMTAYDPRTGYFWVGGVTFFGENSSIYVARKAPGAAGFEPLVVINDESTFDKGWLAAGRGPSSPSTTRLYVAYNLGLQTSADLGATWSAVTPLDPLGIGFHPRVGPGGELYVSYWDFDLGNWIYRSLDGGQTIQGPFRTATRIETWNTQDGTRAPGSFRLANISFLAVDPTSGTLYSAYHDVTRVTSGESDLDVYLTRSTDQGSTWSTPLPVTASASNPPADQFIPWLEVDQRGRLHLLFFDTRHAAQSDNDANALVDVYYALSEDGGDTWAEIRLTDTSFESADGVWEVGGQFLGDYLGASVHGDTLHVIYPTAENGDQDIWTRRIELPTNLIFSDGFEGDLLSHWSAVVP